MRIICEQTSEKSITESLRVLLEDSIICSIATVTSNGHAYISDVYFSYSPEMDFYFISSPDTVHCRNIAGNPTMALSVHRPQREWGNPDHGVQLFGHCREARDAERAAAVAVYAKRFPAYAAEIAAKNPGDEVAERLRGYGLFHFVPDNIKLLDEKRFGGAVLISAVIQRD
jgi:uncharacterized protein